MYQIAHDPRDFIDDANSDEDRLGNLLTLTRLLSESNRLIDLNLSNLVDPEVFFFQQRWLPWFHRAKYADWFRDKCMMPPHSHSLGTRGALNGSLFCELIVHLHAVLQEISAIENRRLGFNLKGCSAALLNSECYQTASINVDNLNEREHAKALLTANGWDTFGPNSELSRFNDVGPLIENGCYCTAQIRPLEQRLIETLRTTVDLEFEKIPIAEIAATPPESDKAGISNSLTRKGGAKGRAAERILADRDIVQRWAVYKSEGRSKADLARDMSITLKRVDRALDAERKARIRK